MPTIEELKEEGWSLIAETMKEALEEALVSGQRTHPGFEKHDRERIRKHMERVFDRTLAAMKPEAGDLPLRILAFFDGALEEFFELFIPHYRQAALEEKENFMREVGSSFAITDFEASINEAIANARKFVDVAVATPRAIEAAIKANDFAKAEAIVRGEMAKDPESFAMLNHLFHIGCYSGNAALVVEARAGAKGNKACRIAPEAISRDAIAVFLQKAVAEGIIASMDPLTQPGLLVKDGPSQSQMDELRTTVETINSQAVEEIIRRFVGSDTWNPEEFLRMCREVIFAKCKAYEKWLPGRQFLPQWKGMKLPPCVKPIGLKP